MANAESSRPALPNLHERAREIAAVLLFGVAAFALLACSSFLEPNSQLVDRSFANLCGPAGITIAKAALYGFGYAAYLGIFVVFVWALALFSRRPVSLGPFRLLWFSLSLLICAALFSHFLGNSSIFGKPEYALPGAGGLIGFQIAGFIETTLMFGSWGTGLTLLILSLITFQLATDFVLYSAMVGAFHFVAERRHAAGELIKKTGPLFASLLGERHANDADKDLNDEDLPVRRTRRKRVEIGVTDDEVEGFAAARVPEDEERGRRKSKRAVHVDDVDVEFGDEPAVAAGRTPSKATRTNLPPANAEFDLDEEVEMDADDLPTPAPTKGTKSDKKSLALSAVQAASKGAEPPMLDEDDEADIGSGLDDEDDGLPESKEPKEKKTQAKIHYEPPKGPAASAANMDKEHVVFVAPPQKKAAYEFPSKQLLEKSTPVPAGEFQAMIERNIEELEHALASYKIDAEVEEIQKGPVITMFELNVAAGTRVDRIRALEDDLAIRLKAPSVRIVAPIPGKSTIGIEVPNSIRETVRMRELVESPEYKSEKFAIPVFLGKDASGRVLIEDLAKMPHALIAGATGAGKSVCLNSIIMSVLFTRSPEQVRMILIDPKMVELSTFENIPHLMCPVVRDMNKAAQILEWACTKMDERYEILAEVGARNIFAYNKIPEDQVRSKLGISPDDQVFEARMPFIVIVVDELADLMMVGTKDIETHITRLAQKSRAVGIHVILATQRPSTNVITGLIKANMPTRISFQVASKIDSRVVLDQNGAEKLLGFGDMLYMPPRSAALIRSQGTFVTDEEITAVVNAVKTNSPLYAPELMQKKATSTEDPREIDDLYEEAVQFVLESRRGSASLLQRRFSIGYTRASRLIDLMANEGILGEYKNAQAREVVMNLEEYDEMLKERYGMNKSQRNGRSSSADGGDMAAGS